MRALEKFGELILKSIGYILLVTIALLPLALVFIGLLVGLALIK